MELAFLSQVKGILGPFAWIMGKILNGIFNFLELFGIGNIAVCIVLFTIVVKMLMLPLTIKQQKGTRVSAKMNPEIQQIQARYKGKKDQASLQKQQMEMQEVYAKYGASPLSGCLPLLISLPIMFALYKVVYAIPAYVTDVKALYDTVASNIMNIDGYVEGLTNFINTNKIAISDLGKLANIGPDSESAKTFLIDIFSQFNTENWNAFLDTSKWIGEEGVGVDIANFFTNSIDQLRAILSSGTVTKTVDDIINVNRFIGGMNILDRAGYTFPGILIPIVAAGTQYLQTKFMNVQSQNQNSNPNPAGDTMKTMNTVMPIVSGIFCVFMPIAVGIYWITSSVVQIFQQIFINKYFDKVGMDEMIAKNVAKSNKKKEKYGVVTGNKNANVARTSTKVINPNEALTKPKAVNLNTTKTVSSDNNKSEVSYKAGSISAYANILKRNNSDKGDK